MSPIIRDSFAARDLQLKASYDLRHPVCEDKSPDDFWVATKKWRALKTLTLQKWHTHGFEHMLQHVMTPLQHTATHCNTLQHAATQSAVSRDGNASKSQRRTNQRKGCHPSKQELHLMQHMFNTLHNSIFIQYITFITNEDKRLCAKSLKAQIAKTRHCVHYTPHV